MMDKPFALAAVKDDELWEHIRQHRMAFTAMVGVDYEGGIRSRLCLTPPQPVLSDWEEDYRKMCQTMIYGDRLPFDKLMERMHELERRFRERE